jgi:hypothetical protein
VTDGSIVWLDDEAPWPEEGEDWTPRRPADMDLEDETLEAELLVHVAHRILEEKRANAKRAATLAARTQLAALAAKEDLDAAIELCVDALWHLAEVAA